MDDDDVLNVAWPRGDMARLVLVGDAWINPDRIDCVMPHRVGTVITFIGGTQVNVNATVETVIERLREVLDRG